MDTVYKVFENCEVKKVGEREYEFIASTADIDRDGEVIDVHGWDLKNFKKNPVIMYGHDYRSLPIGKATQIGVRGGNLINTVQFPPEGTYDFADIVERLVNTGYLKTESVGFIPKKWEDGDFDDEKANKPRRTYTKQELLEISIVPVPSNPNALAEAVQAGVITQKQLKTIEEAKGLDDIGENDLLDIQGIDIIEVICPKCGGDKFETEDNYYICIGCKTRFIPTNKEDLVTKPEEDDEFIRIPVRDCKVTATIDISEKEGISALYCGKEKKVRTYIFRKDKGWTMAKAKEWVKEHDSGKGILPDNVHNKTAKEVSQDQIKDEIDYLETLIKENGMNDVVKESLQSLADTYIERVPDDDTSVDEEKDIETTQEEILDYIKNLNLGG